MKHIVVVIVLLILSLGGSAHAQPNPEVSEYFKTRGGGAVVDAAGDKGAIYFGLILDWIKRPQKGAFVVAEFENTENGAAPYIVEQSVTGLEPSITLKSPLYPCVINDSHYNVLVKLFSDSTKTTLLGTHAQQIYFALPTRQLRDLKLKKCGA